MALFIASCFLPWPKIKNPADVFMVFSQDSGDREEISIGWAQQRLSHGVAGHRRGDPSPLSKDQDVIIDAFLTLVTSPGKGGGSS